MNTEASRDMARHAEIERESIERGFAKNAITFKVWRVHSMAPRFEATPVELPEIVTSADEAAQYATLHHKDGVIVQTTDVAQCPERQNMLSIYVVRKRSNPKLVRGPDGQPMKEPAEYPELMMQFCAAEFEPVEPWKMARGADISGRDLTLIEGNCR